ncbi:uncharacterized protein LOC115927679 [Strongylocentrotus purpuratus]|uniref:Integrase catalytic domain-containing protein n=1 Tax=Strongylocentrotus purpuratus TaxID=7668 RepID=A0A7M7T2S7_STRPU|nr:uncharacterized protein LOC115927679 [Strongylocentrotus purpuratus]
MTAKAEASVFWPGITTAISNLRARCDHYNQIAPSNPSSPPTPLTSPVYPFQCICADFFHYKGCNYLVVVDRYSNWPILALDGGPEFTAAATRRFLQDWGIHHRLSSVEYTHSNCPAEVGVNTIRRLLLDNNSPTGALDADAFQRAMIQYRNTPDRDIKLSPAMCVFGLPIRDFIPVAPGKYEPHRIWRETSGRCTAQSPHEK